jgi:hypothetical protein
MVPINDNPPEVALKWALFIGELLLNTVGYELCTVAIFCLYYCKNYDLMYDAYIFLHLFLIYSIFAGIPRQLII